MKLLQRLALALIFAGIGAVSVRLGGASNTAPQRGGWQPLELPER